MRTSLRAAWLPALISTVLVWCCGASAQPTARSSSFQLDAAGSSAAPFDALLAASGAAQGGVPFPVCDPSGLLRPRPEHGVPPIFRLVRSRRAGTAGARPISLGVAVDCPKDLPQLVRRVLVLLNAAHQVVAVLRLLGDQPTPADRRGLSRRCRVPLCPASAAWSHRVSLAMTSEAHASASFVPKVSMNSCRFARSRRAMSRRCAGMAMRMTAARRVDGSLEIAIVGAKVNENAGQPWRRLVVADDLDGPVAHLLHLADAVPDGVAMVCPDASPAALSMAVTRLGAECGFTRRLSAYDLRHQRCADARAAFGQDIEKVSAWLGHSGTETARHYARSSGGCRGARPLACRPRCSSRTGRTPPYRRLMQSSSYKQPTS